ncbi:MAG: serine--tRNA ligase [Candidatus Marinimicrobia bacterium]|nr:serine--tRNA ligase [Candidatus Neomarinimicrobiota bacterium]
MLSLKFIRENIDKVKLSLQHKNVDFDLETLFSHDDKRRDLIQVVEQLKSERNTATKVIADKKKNGEDATTAIEKMRAVSEKIKVMDQDLKQIDDQIFNNLLFIPNVYHDSVPIGQTEGDNALVREWGKKPQFNFTPLSHLELSEKYNLFDFKRATKMSGSGFPLYRGMGAKLERALINFMLNFHVEKHGYEELFPPFLTTREATTTTGQLPKFQEDMYHISGDDLYCISTAEVPVTNIHRDEQLEEENFPYKYTAYSACFRREAGSYGKDTRGLLRLHQFNKVEMVQFVHPDTSYEILETLVNDAEDILQALGLHYKVVALCTGDLSFSAAKCYDIELWAPGEDKYLEVSSCSNFESFQARRGNIRFRRSDTNKLDFVHTLNGSGVATPRLMVALLETYQKADGSIEIPEVLVPFMGIDTIK